MKKKLKTCVHCGYKHNYPDKECTVQILPKGCKKCKGTGEIYNDGEDSERNHFHTTCPRCHGKKMGPIEWNGREFRIAHILIEELQGWKSTTAVSTTEFKRLVKRLSGIISDKSKTIE